MKRFVIGVLASALGLMLVTGRDAGAAEPDHRPPLELRRIMNELSQEMQRVTAAIAREDWATIERTAPRIASHRQPPASEKARILAFVGGNVAKFRAHDRKTHDAAEALGAAAGRQDGAAVIAAFRDVQRGCHSCHRDFRKPFVEHFYGGQ